MAMLSAGGWAELVHYEVPILGYALQLRLYVIAGFAAVLAICSMAKPSRAAYKSAGLDIGVVSRPRWNSA
jgi:hypothetical protein